MINYKPIAAMTRVLNSDFLPLHNSFFKIIEIEGGDQPLLSPEVCPMSLPLHIIGSVARYLYKVRYQVP
jgi:hypothetical protein